MEKIHKTCTFLCFHVNFKHESKIKHVSIHLVPPCTPYSIIMVKSLFTHPTFLHFYFYFFC